MGDRRLDVGRTGRRRQRPGHPCGRGPRRQLDRHGADLRLRALGSRRRPRPARAARGAPAAGVHQVRPRRGQRDPDEVGDPRRRCCAECDASLRALGVDAIDLYQLHWPVEQPIPETAAACAELLKAGKIRAIGVSNYSVAQLEEWRATGVPLHSVQSPYSLLRPAIAADVLPYAAKTNLGVIAYSPLFRGMLFGTWKKGKTFAEGDTRGAHKDYQGARFERHLDAVAALRELATDNGLSVPQLARRRPAAHAGPDRLHRRRAQRPAGRDDREPRRRRQRRAGRRGRADHGVAARGPGEVDAAPAAAAQSARS